LLDGEAAVEEIGKWIDCWLVFLNDLCHYPDKIIG
jgi:hypothetical protein